VAAGIAMIEPGPLVAQTLTQPSPTPSVLRSPPAGPVETIGAFLAIVFALAAGIIGYRIIRGGRGL
jgi:hypothetical protein